MKVILLGAPACGKGTLTSKLVRDYDVVHVAPGDMLRENISRETELGMRAKSYMDQGVLVPTELVVELIKDKLISSGNNENKSYIFDGFPRSFDQVKEFDKMLEELNSKIDKVINLNVPKEVLVSRIVGRIVCPKCGESYNIETAKPKEEGICDKCGTALIKRSDDNEVVFGARLNTYNEQTAPIIELYRQRGQLIEIPYIEDADELYSEVKKALGI